VRLKHGVEFRWWVCGYFVFLNKKKPIFRRVLDDLEKVREGVESDPTDPMPVPLLLTCHTC
jgi:hypothetical protein